MGFSVPSRSAVPAVDLTPVTGSVAALQTSLASLQGSVGANQSAIAALQGAKTSDEAAAAAVAASVTALQNRIATDEATITAVGALITALQNRATSDESGIAANAAAVATLQGQVSSLQTSRTADEATIATIQGLITALQTRAGTDESGISANTAAISTLQGQVSGLLTSRTADESTIAANSAAITALQNAKTTDEASIAANTAAIQALQQAKTTDEATLASHTTAISALQGRLTTDEATIAANTAAITALQAGAPYVHGPIRLWVNSVDDAVQIARYVVSRPDTRRTYSFSLVNPSTANALSLTNAGVLSTVASGFDNVAANAAVTATVRATDDLGATFDQAINVARVVIPSSSGASAANLATLRRVYISSVEITSSNSSYNFTGAVPAGATEVLMECVGAGASGFTGKTDGSMAGHGGQPGSVSRDTKRVVDVPSPIAVTIGAGGAGPGLSSVCASNPGGATTFGSLLSAPGGRGGSYTALTDYAVGQLDQPSNPPVGSPGFANTNGANVASNNLLSAAPSYGPSGGGAGLYNSNKSSPYVTGAGGASGIHLPGSTLAQQNSGSAGYWNGVNAVAGADAPNVFGYGQGGNGSTGSGNGGNGGAGGGGGGGGGCLPGQSGVTGQSGVGGTGGRGAIRLHFYKYESP